MSTATQDLAAKYDPKSVEGEILRRWQDSHAFHADPTAPGDPFCIVIPPPNVTAALHMGHALNNTIQDILIRWHRMRGDNTVWMPGTDHAGIATQTVVDKRLQAENQPALKDYKKLEAEGKGGRDKFIEKVQAWKDEYEAVITNQLKTMGCSCDWDRQRFTMDPVCAAAVREAFFQLFKDGLIYRGKRLVNWDPVTQTALADDEVEMETVDGHFWYMKYPVVDDAGNATGEFVTVATTRPETMLGDTAVAVNPGDPDRAKYIGQFVKLPIVNRIIPVVGDDYVVKPDPEASDEKARFASGFLKVTPAHDPNDYEIGQRHNLAVINVMGPDASISRDHGWPAAEFDSKQVDAFCHDLLGMDRYEAREAIVTWFREQGLLEDVRPYSHSVGHSYRSHVPVEPYLSDQWYVKVTDDRLAGAALKAMAKEQRSDSDGCAWKDGKAFATGDGQLKFYPPRYAKTFQHWHENIRDWCISRQLWWGHRIPVWHKRVTLTEHNWHDELLRWGWDSYLAGQWEDSVVRIVRTDGTEVDPAVDSLMPITADSEGDYDLYICTRRDEDATGLADHGFTQDPDVLDTWFSSGLWPISTMGWPAPGNFPTEIPEGDALLDKWNPGSVLCTAREIITLWVSRMVMFNRYFRGGKLPFTDVFIHAMIQDGEGQKMSKSLGNGVDPLDIIHSHGSDAMRFTLASMTTQTQDVRMPVDLVCPHTGEAFTPKMITDKAGYRVAAPVQDCPSDASKKIVSSYGVASGKAVPSADMPVARNTSSKFDFGRNFANKLWNAMRFTLNNLAEAKADASSENAPALTLVDRWILSRTAATLREVDRALEQYDFHQYAQKLYQFVWNDLCDWTIEAMKPTIRTAEGATSRRVLATVFDVTLRLLHPSMPFITEKLFAALNDTCTDRGVPGLEPEPADLLVKAPWPVADASLIDPQTEEDFSSIQKVVTASREFRAHHQIPVREPATFKFKPAEHDPSNKLQSVLEVNGELIETFTHMRLQDFDLTSTAISGTASVGNGVLYIRRESGANRDIKAERELLSKKREDAIKAIRTLEGRLSNKGYTEKAPANLVQQTRDQLTAAQAEFARLEQELASLN